MKYVCRINLLTILWKGCLIKVKVNTSDFNLPSSIANSFNNFSCILSTDTLLFLNILILKFAIPGRGLYLETLCCNYLKVRQSRNVLFKPTILPKNEQMNSGFLPNSTMIELFRSFFGRI